MISRRSGFSQILAISCSVETAHGLDLHGVDHYVDNYWDHVHHKGTVLAEVRLTLMRLLVDVDGAKEDGQDSLGDLKWCDKLLFTSILPCIWNVSIYNLKTDRDGDQGEHEMVKLVLLSSVQDELQLGGVRSQQGNVQHSLRDRLLGRISVGVDSLHLWRSSIW